MSMAFALPLRFENNAQAQITYFSRIGDAPGPPVGLGNEVTIGVDRISGTTFITGHTPPPFGSPFVPGRPTSDHPLVVGTVFENLGGPSVINAERGATGAGAVISTLAASPAIINGRNTMTIGTVARSYQVRVTLTAEGFWTIEYGYSRPDEPDFFFPITDFDELPVNIQDYEIIPGMPLWEDTPPEGTAILPPGLSLGGMFASFEPGQSAILPPMIFIIDGQIPDPVTGALISPPMIPAGIFDPDVLPPLVVAGGSMFPGILTINARPTIGDPDFDPNFRNFYGDDRTLIQSAGGEYGVIRNHGTLTVNDARIQVAGGFGGVGIYHSYSRGMSFVDESLFLNNTQIGSPGGTRTILVFDPITQTIEEIEIGGAGIEVDQNGRPRQIATRIRAGDTIMAEGVNGRIVAGQNEYWHPRSSALLHRYSC
jgi:hypothetical protein